MVFFDPCTEFRVFAAEDPLNVGGTIAVPWRTIVSTNVYYGSGLTNAFPGQPFSGAYLPQHTTFDLSLAKDFGELSVLEQAGRNAMGTISSIQPTEQNFYKS